MEIKITDQKQTGVSSEVKRMRFEAGAIRTDAHMTIPAREEIERVSKVRDNAYFFRQPPTGIVVVIAPVNGAGLYKTAYRCAHEQPFPGEQPNPDMWIEVDLTPCPKCGAALIWYETGHVPGYRICAGKSHHHFIASTFE